ncbi:hypothetical protein C818_02147 [Lachnospiraceae bacterium MD308]|nr:hypothetical protein C818_02147 [Lachnospiraceae bacterium MD308]
MRIQHNITALSAYRNLTNNNSAVSKNLEKLSSGYRINRAGDDAAGLAISEKMRAQITGLKTAQKNANDGISLVQTAEGALTEVHSMLNRMVELANQSANGTYQDEDRQNLQSEIEQLKDEIDRIADGTNFNGISLLDGSLSAKGGATNVTIGGNASSYKSAGVKGVFAADTTWGAGPINFTQEGDTFEYTVSLADGTTHNIKLTAEKDSSGKLNKLVGSDGQVYAMTTSATGAAATQAEIDAAILGELNKTSLAKDYNITMTGGKATFTALKEGTDTPAIKAIDAEWTIGGARQTQPKIGVDVTTAPLDAGREIDASSINLYNGKNYDDAVFTINGHKFVVMTSSSLGASLGEQGTDMNATHGLGSDVTILIADDNGGLGLKAADKNFQQNIEKIAEVTGLKVTDAVTDAGADKVAPGAGIRLSAGEASGGLVLQIGDTSDDFNKLRVSVKDMHAKAMGIADIDVSTQTGAAAAVDKIKAAINYVSTTRGDLGAIQNRLEHTINNLSVTTENMTAAESRIRDVDMAEEMMAYTKNNILVQASQAMLAQANQIPQGVLQLLQ